MKDEGVLRVACSVVYLCTCLPVYKSKDDYDNPNNYHDNLGNAI